MSVLGVMNGNLDILEKILLKIELFHCLVKLISFLKILKIK